METKTNGKKTNLAALYGKYGIFAILLLIILFSCLFVRGFATGNNITNITRQIAVVTILALGATFVITLGHTNVSYGSCIALIGCVSCAVMVSTNNVFLAVLAALLLGLLIGIINGLIITRFKIPAFIMTLAITTVARGAALLFTNGTPVTGMGQAFLEIGQGYVGPIPISLIIMLLLFGISWMILNKTTFGRHIYAVGGNENAALASGINSVWVQRKAFMIDGLMTAVAAVVWVSRMNSGQPGQGIGYEFDAITAVVVGGTSLAGGSGSVVGTVAGALLVGIINNVQNLMNVNTYWQQIVKGLIILAAVVIDVVTKEASRKRT